MEGGWSPLGDPGSELRAGLQVQLPEYPPNMGRRRVLRDGEFLGYLAVGKTPCDKQRNLFLTAGEDVPLARSAPSAPGFSRLGPSAMPAKVSAEIHCSSRLTNTTKHKLASHRQERHRRH